MATFKDLIVYKKAFGLAMRIFHLTKSFPPEEKYSLTSQVRRSSRAVCANVAEGYRKRQYPAHFVAKVSDAELMNQILEIGKLLNHMINFPEKYQIKTVTGS